MYICKMHLDAYASDASAEHGHIHAQLSTYVHAHVYAGSA